MTQQAKSIKQTSESPQQAIERIIDAVLDEIYVKQNVPNHIRQQAQRFKSSFNYADATYLGPETRRAAGREYDSWSDDIFNAIQAGDYREDLVRDFITRLEYLIDQNKSDALFALIVEELTDGRNFIRFQLTEHCSPTIKKGHWRNYNERIAEGGDNAFFRSLLEPDAEQTDIGVWYGASLTDVFPYQGEFDSLIQAIYKKSSDQSERLSKPLDAFWLSAIKLESEEADQPHRLLFIAYPNQGTPASPKVGRAAPQEWRMLQLLRIAYRQVDHAIRNLERRIAVQRPQLIRDLGPSFLAHELQTHLANLHDLHAMMVQKLSVLNKDYPDDPNVHSAGKRLVQTVQETVGIFRVVKGYNNLMRASSLESFSLLEVMDEMLAITKNRRLVFAKVRTLIERERMQNIQLETDRALLLVTLVNIIVNATQAIHEQRPPQGNFPVPEGGDQICILMESEPNDSHVQLAIANTGSEIAVENRERIFRRGFTTRSSGTGQGLYLCRQILSYLGGSIKYVDPALLERGLPAGAGFQIEFMLKRALDA